MESCQMLKEKLPKYTDFKQMDSKIPFSIYEKKWLFFNSDKINKLEEYETNKLEEY